MSQSNPILQKPYNDTGIFVPFDKFQTVKILNREGLMTVSSFHTSNINRHIENPDWHFAMGSKIHDIIDFKTVLKK